jgi:hypothetical protein
MPPNNRQRSRPSRHILPSRDRRTGRSGILNAALPLCALAAVLGWQLAPQLNSTWALMNSSPQEIEKREASLYFPNCSAARAAGAAPIYAGDPGYREEMDGDLDGIACEPYR